MNKGILLHITSLYEKNHLGSLGKEAYKFIDFLATKNFSYWQVLPLAPTTFGDSPYMSICSFAGNEQLIDLGDLQERGLLSLDELATYSNDPHALKDDYLRLAHSRFLDDSKQYIAFINQNFYWLHDYALFQTLKVKLGYLSLSQFPPEYKKRQGLFNLEKIHYLEISYWFFVQYIFDLQWKKIRSYANSRNIQIIGDMPIYVALDSSDVWGNAQNFLVDEEYNPTVVAGVPPDYFSKSGQKWGNPLYNWNYLKRNNFSFLQKRINRNLEMVDILRIDHFIGFFRYYAIPQGLEAIDGIYYPTPYTDFFKMIDPLIKGEKLIAEDLGLLTKDIDLAIKDLGIPRMKVFEFLLEDKENLVPFINYPRAVCYTGTHDNDTLVGWLSSKTTKELEAIKNLVNPQLDATNLPGFALAIIQKIHYLESYLTIYPIQDLLLLDSKARMNIPGTSTNNWKFQLSVDYQDQLNVNFQKFFDL
ncbi:MAG: 4-alpha-glucanotransferase [Acholeplasmatales bacterium]|jgi:4-alpha-glucanotransferase|nr:4-alpha-glucanotransferase [Acholeplasmatales bacterium]